MDNKPNNDPEDWRRPEPPTPGECYGCRKPLPCTRSGREDPQRVAELDLGGGFLVRVCSAFRIGYGSPWKYAARACIRKAVERACVCGGCGLRLSSNLAGGPYAGVCDDCREKIAVAARAEDQPRAWYGVTRGRLMPDDLGRTSDDAALADLLVEAAAGPGLVTRDLPEYVPEERKIPRADYYARDPDLYVRLTEGQASAFGRLAGSIADYGRRQFARGRAQGRLLLHQLADGELTIQQFDDITARQLEEERRVNSRDEESDEGT
jgi:hypothetical protein